MPALNNVSSGIKDAAARSCVVGCFQIKCTLMSLLVQRLKDRPVMTSLTTVHHFSAFIDLSVWLCVRVCDKDKDTDSCVIMSPPSLSLYLVVPFSLCFRMNHNYLYMWFQWAYLFPWNTTEVIRLKVGQSIRDKAFVSVSDLLSLSKWHWGSHNRHITTSGLLL